MRLTLHIFKKDARRLWWEVTVTLGLLVSLSWMDVHRADFIPGSLEGWLHVILPAAWVYLIALLVHEEALIGDRQFWITRPYPWSALLAAKALFVAAFIHVPLLAADAAILAARGFEPWDYVPHLLWKQLLLAAMLTLPAVALAAVTRNLAQFLMSTAAIALTAIFLAGKASRFGAPWVAADEARRLFAMVVLTPAGTAILLMQYARRRTALSRAVGIGALALAGALFAWTPRADTWAVRCALSPVHTDNPALTIRVTPRNEPPPRLGFGTGVAYAAIPITVLGLPDGVKIREEQLGFEIVGPAGERWKGPTRPAFEPITTGTVKGGIGLEDRNTGWQIVILGRSVWEQIRNLRVTLRGQLAATFYREEKPVWIPVGTEHRLIPRLGRCSAVYNRNSDLFGESLLKVVCESPSDIPVLTPVKLVDAASGSEWNNQLGDSAPVLHYPVQTWLSPLHRRETFFHVVAEAPHGEGSKWLVPESVLSTANVGLVPQEETGCAAVQYEFRDLPIRAFAVREPKYLQ
jgi:hypothetical protein